MDRARMVDAANAANAVGEVIDAVDPLAEEIRQSVFLLLGALGLMGMVAVALLVITTGSGG